MMWVYGVNESAPPIQIIASGARGNSASMDDDDTPWTELNLTSVNAAIGDRLGSAVDAMRYATRDKIAVSSASTETTMTRMRDPHLTGSAYKAGSGEFKTTSKVDTDLSDTKMMMRVVCYYNQNSSTVLSR